MVATMKAAIDSAGRLVVPKQLRDALGLVAGQELELRVVDSRLEIEVPPTPMRLEKKGRSYVAVPTKRLPPLTAGQVREALERTRR